MARKKRRVGKNVVRLRGTSGARAVRKKSLPLAPADGGTAPDEPGSQLRLVGGVYAGGDPVRGIVGRSRPGTSDPSSWYRRHGAIPLPDTHVPREILGDAAALFRAARLGRGDDVSRLLEKGADPDLTDDPGDQHRDAISFMCENEDLGKVDLDGIKLGRTACHMAALRGHADVVQALIQGGCDVDFRDHAGETALMLAARKGFVHVGSLLVQAGAEVDARDRRGATALLRAAEAGHAEFVRFLLLSGADVDASDRRHRTPLIAGAARLDEETVRVLLAAGADVGLRDAIGADALGAAVCATASPEPGTDSPVHAIDEERIQLIVALLVDAGARDDPGELQVRPSQWAWQRGHERVARLLLERSS